MCYYFNDIIKLENFDLNILIILKYRWKIIWEKILIYDISDKTVIGLKHF